MIKKVKLSIRVKLLIALIASLLLASLIFYLVYQFGGFLVWRYYLDESNKQERAQNYVEDFQAYVTRNKLAINDTEKISNWTAGQYVDLIVYKDSNLVYAPEWFEDFQNAENGKGESDETAAGDMQSGDESGAVDMTESEAEGATGDELFSDTDTDTDTDTENFTDTSFQTETETETIDYSYENWFSGDRGFEQYLTEEALKDYRAALEYALGESGTLHPVYFVDGTLIVAVVDYSEDVLNNLVFAISIFSALVVVAVIMICFFGTVTNRIRSLAKNVRVIGEGNLEHKIVASGNDEISSLASDVNSMRDAIVDNMTRERRAWEANAGLITAMSHDIRTPLTVLLGYIDLIDMQNDGRINDEYISACRDNALRLKNLSDDMFSYFFVFGRGEGELKMIRINVNELVRHVVSEHALLLQEKGYVIDGSIELPERYVFIDEQYFKRVIDNIFSNVLKYADKDNAVILSAECRENELVFSCTNVKRTDKDIPESNGIGLKTCTKMMEEMGGRLSYSENEGSFTVNMILPLEKKDDKSNS